LAGCRGQCRLAGKAVSARCAAFCVFVGLVHVMLLFVSCWLAIALAFDLDRELALGFDFELAWIVV